METLFREVTTRICSSLQIDEALFDVYLYLKSYLPLDGICITVYEYETKTARIIAGAYDSGGILVNRSFPVSETAWKAVQKWQKESRSETTPWIRDEKHPINNEIKKVMTHFAPADYFQMLEQFSSITCALKIRDEIIGNLTFVGFGKDRYNKSHGDIITEVNEPFAIALSNALRFMELEKNNRQLQKEARQVKGDVMIGGEGGLKQVRKMIESVAPTHSHVLLQGETGTGKEVVANEIHKLSLRSAGPLISLNCGAIPENLIDSELFGHEKGSFTGAVETRAGRFERADKGTLFMDEVGELPLSAQTKLLRVIQTGEFERVGGVWPVKCDVRLICATHRNLMDMVQKKTFREDLWYRLNVFPITIPPLRSRTQDIEEMVEYFIMLKCQEMNIPNPGIAKGELDNLKEYPWPGNVRELQNLIERALILFRGEPLSFPDLIRKDTQSMESPEVMHDKKPALDDTIAEHIRWALSKCNGKISGRGGAAQLLSVNPNTLRSRMQKLKIEKVSKYTRKV